MQSTVRVALFVHIEFTPGPIDQPRGGVLLSGNYTTNPVESCKIRQRTRKILPTAPHKEWLNIPDLRDFSDEQN